MNPFSNLQEVKFKNTSKYLSVSVKSMLDMSLYVNPKKWVMLQNKNLVGPKKGF